MKKKTKRWGFGETNDDVDGDGDDGDDTYIAPIT